MKRIYLLTSALVLSLNIWAQSVDVENDEILEAGQAIARIEKEGCGAFSHSCNFYISDLSGSQLITVVGADLKDPDRASSGNPDGKVSFLRISFTGRDEIAEIRNPSLMATRAKDVAKSIIKAKLIKDGKLDESAVNNFIRANGTRFTDREKQLHPTTIIINNK
ncbi:MAG: hypothetical protein JST36_01175 [Bacteroidetes bacterium]|nr:hypothetical protein [Bacteroidota bacterium]